MQLPQYTIPIGRQWRWHMHGQGNTWSKLPRWSPPYLIGYHYGLLPSGRFPFWGRWMSRGGSTIFVALASSLLIKRYRRKFALFPVRRYGEEWSGK